MTCLLYTSQPGLVPGSVLAKFEGSPAEHPLFKEGCFHVEGQASQLADVYKRQGLHHL